MAGTISNLKSGGFGEAHRVRQMHRPVGIEHAKFRQTALTAENRGALSGLEIGHIRAYSINGSGDLHPKHEGRRWRVLIPALDHQQIGEVETAGRDLQAQLTGARIWPGNLLQIRLRPEALLKVSAHEISLRIGNYP